ncbi:hypothetical protein N1028_15415 [Herbiconiux sp. CPCC 203407]|uniref:Uncharacterized protein n=2 Tax=Herbiconiux oxytropis TaxID=2970915 RepID=A0AA42BWV5_9MICO|nr:hypothetical protein [Herbiconiux oxytropis]MCS5727283.1 hypothetical protein [Herbiconiux oxytropis]
MFEFSMGAFGLFFPDKYVKGRGVREPADLAWVSRDVLLLLCAQRSGASADVQHRHNIRQLDGWLRVWADDRPLVGRNASQEFTILPSEPEAIVLVSVVSANEVGCRIVARTPRAHVANDERVLIEVLVHERVLLRLASLGGTALDLADLFLLASAASAGELALDDAEKALLDAHDNAVERAAARDVTGPLDPQLLPRVAELIPHSYPLEAIHNLKAIGMPGVAGFSVFNDLDFESANTLVRCFTETVQVVCDVPLGSMGPGAACVLREIGGYEFFLAANSIEVDAPEINAQFEKHLDADSIPQFLQAVIVGRPQVQFMTAIVSLRDPRRPTATGACLRLAADTFSRTLRGSSQSADS